MEDATYAVGRLTEHHTEATDAGPVSWPPLLDWLEQAVTTIMARGGGGGGDGAGVPFNTAALDLLKLIDSRLKLMREALGSAPARNRIEAVKVVWKLAGDERAGGRMDDDQWGTICDEFEDWVMRIEAEDDRPSKMELTTACPRCEQRWVLDNGNRVAAIVIEYKTGRAPVAECRNAECMSHWVGWAEVAKLGFTVGATQDESVLAACGIDLPGIVMDTVPR